LSGGGTAGHIYPALALADRLGQLGNDIMFVGTDKGLESKLVARAGIDFVALPAAGFDRSKPLSFFTSGATVALSSLKAKKLLRDFGAQAVVGFGGYVSIPVGIAASRAHIPLIIHEQNSVAGMTNGFLAKRASLVCLTYSDTVDAMEKVAKGKVIVTGNPVREEILTANRASARAGLGLEEDDVFIFVFGGSRGARHLNAAFTSFVGALLDHGCVKVMHMTGAGEYDAVCESLGDLADDTRLTVRPYVENMGEVLAASDLAICRAGATSIAELTALGVPSVLVPYPYATDDHQTKNARAMVDHGAARLTADSEIDSGVLRDTVFELVDDPALRRAMGQASSALGVRNATELLVDGIYSVINNAK